MDLLVFYHILQYNVEILFKITVFIYGRRIKFIFCFCEKKK